MTPQPLKTLIRVLLVESHSIQLGTTSELLKHRQFSAQLRCGVVSALAALTEKVFDVILVVEDVPELESLREAISSYPVLWLSLKLQELTCARRLKVPVAQVFGLPPTDPDALVHAILNRLDSAHLTSTSSTSPVELLGDSKEWKKVWEVTSLMGSNDSNVLLTGPTGTGKTVLAANIHRNSSRRDRPFVSMHLPGLPLELQYSGLFGHKKGAFTSAYGDRMGAFLQAAGGTLFIDEVGELHPSIQTALLRVLQEKCFTPLGSDREVPANTRLVFATNRNLIMEVEAGRFRSDLLYRLATVVIDIPPLSARPGDAILLARSFADRMGRTRFGQAVVLSLETEAWIEAHSWPGNVRELERYIESGIAILKTGEFVLHSHHFEHSISNIAKPHKNTDQTQTNRAITTNQTLENYLNACSREYLVSLINRFEGDWVEIAKVAGYRQDRTLRMKAERLGLYSQSKSRDIT